LGKIEAEDLFRLLGGTSDFLAGTVAAKGKTFTVRKMIIVRAVRIEGRREMPAKSNLRLGKPTTEKRAVAPRRQPNRELRSREHLTETEVEKLIGAAKGNRHGHRDATMILVAYRHGLRASEVCDLEWSQIDFASAALHVRRAKNGKPATHPIRGDELRALRKLRREAPKSSFVFVSERGGPFTTDSFNWLVKRAGAKSQPALSGTRAHAPSCLWLRAGERRSRYPLVAGLPRAQKYPAHGAIHRAIADAVQGFLA
jgi:integrase